MTKIYKYPDEVLLRPSENVLLAEAFEIDKWLRDTLKDLDWGDVVGLAAPQIGINKNVFLARDGELVLKTYVNPVITYYSDKKSLKKEGCYSLETNKFDYPVWRAKYIKMRWCDLEGNTYYEKFEGFEAQVLQHEYDHLLGKLCCQKS